MPDHTEYDRNKPKTAGNSNGEQPSSPAGGQPKPSSGQDEAARKNVKSMGALGKTMRGVLKATTNQPKWWAKGMKAAGISMGLGGILKQSQVFTGTLGAIFQIFGAMVDVMLAPFIKPIIIPAIKKLASFIPKMREVGEWLLKGFQKIWPWVWAVIKWLSKLVANFASWWFRNVTMPVLRWLAKFLPWVAEKVGMDVETARARGQAKHTAGRWNTESAMAGWTGKDGKSMLAHIGEKVAETPPIQEKINEKTSKLTQQGDEHIKVANQMRQEHSVAMAEAALLQEEQAGYLYLLDSMNNKLGDIYTANKSSNALLKGIKNMAAGKNMGAKVPALSGVSALGSYMQPWSDAAAKHLGYTPERHQRILNDAFDPDEMRFQRDIDIQRASGITPQNQLGIEISLDRGLWAKTVSLAHALLR